MVQLRTVGTKKRGYNDSSEKQRETQFVFSY